MIGIFRIRDRLLTADRTLSVPHFFYWKVIQHRSVICITSVVKYFCAALNGCQTSKFIVPIKTFFGSVSLCYLQMLRKMH
jgi:hypothetical protein